MKLQSLARIAVAIVCAVALGIHRPLFSSNRQSPDCDFSDLVARLHRVNLLRSIHKHRAEGQHVLSLLKKTPIWSSFEEYEVEPRVYIGRGGFGLILLDQHERVIKVTYNKGAFEKNITSKIFSFGSQILHSEIAYLLMFAESIGVSIPKFLVIHPTQPWVLREYVAGVTFTRLFGYKNYYERFPDKLAEVKHRYLALREIFNESFYWGVKTLGKNMIVCPDGRCVLIDPY